MLMAVGLPHSKNMYDLIIVGGGPAGITAGIYAARKNLKTILITRNFTGQTGRAGVIENWPGAIEVMGPDLVTLFKDHLRSFKIEIKEGDAVTEITKSDLGFEVKTNNDLLKAKSVIIASGRNPRPLKAEGIEQYIGKGVSYCATCDAPLFTGKSVAVIGGGNSGFETAIEMAERNSPKIYLLEMIPKVLADEILQERAAKQDNIKILTEAMVLKIEGDNFVNAITYRDLKTKENKRLEVEGVFVEIGSNPVTDFINDLADCNENGEIIINHKDCSTKTPGLFAAGDVTDVDHKQIVVAAGEGSKAALSAYDYIKKAEWTE